MTDISNVTPGKSNIFADFQLKPASGHAQIPNYISEEDSFESTTETNKEKEKKTKNLGKTIAYSALGVGCGILFLMRGLPKNTYKTLERWMQDLEMKIHEQRKNGQVGRLEEFYTFTINKLNSFMAKAKSVNNFVSIKDITFEKLMSKTKITKKIHSKITEIYESIGRKTINKAYRRAKEKLSKSFIVFDDYDERILRNSHNGTDMIDGKTVKEWLDEIEVLKTKIRRTLNANFGENARDQRFKMMKKDVETLPEEVWRATMGDLDNLTKKQLYETFIAEEKLAGKKLHFINTVNKPRFIITRDIDDIYTSSMDVISNLTSFINSKDTSSRELIKELRIKLIEWKKLSGKNEKSNRNALNSEINKILNNLSNNIRENKYTYKYDDNTVRQMASNIKDITKIMSEDGKGAIQEIYTIYKKLLSREDYIKLKSETQKSVKALNEAVSKETDNFYDMIRDLKLGSAPTDILSILAAVGAVGVGLGKADNKDQQNTVLLKAGIPALGAIITSLYFSASLVSGGRSMAYGAISGGLLNLAGTKLDDYRKKHFPPKPQTKPTQA